MYEQSKAQEQKSTSAERLRSGLQAQAERNARELKVTRAALLRDKEAAVATAVAAKVAELKEAADQATAALTANLEVTRVGQGYTVMLLENDCHAN